jgi:hypothetical protein
MDLNVHAGTKESVVKMTRKKLIALALGLAAVAALLAFNLRDREPVYRGHELSYWIARYNPPAVTPSQEEAYNAINQIGTNAIPSLLHWVAYRPSSFRVKIDPLLYKLPNKFFPNFITRAEERADHASDAFRVLGQRATNAIPALLLLATNSTDREITRRCSWALGYTGASALPALLSISTNSHIPGRCHTIDAIVVLGPDARPAIPFLIECLKEQDYEMVSSASHTMPGLGLASEICVPALVNLCTSADPNRRFCGALSIMGFGEAARVAVPQLQKMMLDPDANVRRQALYALEQVAPEVLTNALPRANGPLRSLRLTIRPPSVQSLPSVANPENP